MLITDITTKMAKSKRNKKSYPSAKSAAPPSSTLPKYPQTLSSLRANHDLWYKILLLIHDLHSVSTSQKRLEQTVDEIYISTPYFSEEEAEFVKAAKIDDDGSETIEEAIKLRLQNFFEKRKASGDWRPCGPHDMGPVFLEGFGVAKEEIRDERFLGRVGRERMG